MFIHRKAEEKQPDPVDLLIEQLVSEMQGYDGHSEEYRNAAVALKTLMEARASERKPDRLSPNTIAVVAGNLAGVVMILIAERTGVVTSKGLGLLVRPKT